MKRFLTILLVFAACKTLAQSEADVLLQERLKAHIEFLAADELRGREPGTEGYDIAAAYVASQFRQMGLVPAGAQDSYFQQVPLRRSWPVEGSVSMTFENGDTEVEFEYVAVYAKEVGPSVKGTWGAKKYDESDLSTMINWMETEQMKWGVNHLILKTAELYVSQLQ